MSGAPTEGTPSPGGIDQAGEGRQAGFRSIHDAFVTALKERLKVVVVCTDQAGRRGARVCIPLDHARDGFDGHSAPQYSLWDCKGPGPDGRQIITLSAAEITSIRLTSERYGGTDFGAHGALRPWQAGEVRR